MFSVSPLLLSTPVEEVVVVHEVPLPPGVVIALPVTHPGEVKPLGVAELVAHEVEVS